MLDGAAIEYCPHCRGLLVASDVLAVVVRKRRAAFRGPPDDPLPLNAHEFRRRVQCPQCRGAMEVHPDYGPGNSIIDSCQRCRLVWLESGELSAIERAPGLR